MSDAKSEDQFKAWIADAVQAKWTVGRDLAEELARQGYDNFLTDICGMFGHHDFGWSRPDAELLASNYILSFEA